MQTLISIFVRTPQGRIAAFDTASQLPSELKALLRAIDGHTPLEVLSKQYKSPDDVMPLLALLQRTGLIVEKMVTHPANSDQTHDQRYTANMLLDLDSAYPAYPRGWPATIPMGLAG